MNTTTLSNFTIVKGDDSQTNVSSEDSRFYCVDVASNAQFATMDESFVVTEFDELTGYSKESIERITKGLTRTDFKERGSFGKYAE